MNPTTSQQQSIDHRELERVSHNKIRVNNPFDDVRTVVWDGFHHPVPAHGYAILDQFLAFKYLEEQAILIMNQTGIQAVRDENKRRVTSNQLPLDRTTKTGEQLGFESPYYLDPSLYTQDPTILEVAQEIGNSRDRMIFVICQAKGLNGGLVEEYGMQYAPQANKPKGGLSWKDVVNRLPGVKPEVAQAPINPVVTSDVTDLNSLSQPKLRSMAKNMGIESEKTDKKADLIAKISQ